MKLEVGTEEVDKVIVEAEAQFQQKADELAQGVAALDERSDKLDALSADLDLRASKLDLREAGLDEREKAVKPSEEEASTEPAKDGKPPKQGTKK